MFNFNRLIILCLILISVFTVNADETLELINKRQSIIELYQNQQNELLYLSDTSSSFLLDSKLINDSIADLFSELNLIDIQLIEAYVESELALKDSSFDIVEFFQEPEVFLLGVLLLIFLVLITYLYISKLGLKRFIKKNNSIYEDQIKTLKDNLDSNSKTLKEIEKISKDNFDKEIKKLNDKILSIQKLNDKLNGDELQFKTEISRLRVDYDKALEELKQIESQSFDTDKYEQEKNNYEKIISDLKSKIVLSDSKIQEVLNQLNEQINLNSGLNNSEFESISKELDIKNKEILYKDETLEKYEDDLTELKLQLEKLNNEISKVINENQILTDKLNGFESLSSEKDFNKEEFQKKYDEVVKDLADERQYRNKIEEELKQFVEELKGYLPLQHN